MRLLHYSWKPLEPLEKREQPRGNTHKPHGLWVSVEGDDDWPTWCNSENFALDGLGVVHEIVLCPGAPVLRISDPAALMTFHRRYATGHEPRYAFDWYRVALDYQGLIIAPYIWEMRMSEEVLWYYTWDCASGCIWDPAAIESVTVLESAA